jgi:hypothetical protein
MIETGMELSGAVDMHVHFGPAAIPPQYASIKPSVTAIQAAREAAGAGFRALVLKAKDSVSAGAAHAAEEAVGGVRVFGGVVLEAPVGGLNPDAVEQTMLLGGKIVWLPTTGSRQDCEAHGEPPGSGIAVTDDNGKVLPGVHEIFDLISAHGALLATGHISYAEHLAVAREFGASGRVIATHAGNPASGPKLDAAQCAELAAAGMIIEFTAATLDDHWGSPGMSMDKHAAMIRAAGVDHAILSSDYGWTSDLPRPVAGLRDYYLRLREAGFGEDEIRLMACDTPARLLGLA